MELVINEKLSKLHPKSVFLMIFVVYILNLITSQFVPAIKVNYSLIAFVFLIVLAIDMLIGSLPTVLNKVVYDSGVLSLLYCGAENVTLRVDLPINDKVELKKSLFTSKPTMICGDKKVVFPLPISLTSYKLIEKFVFDVNKYNKSSHSPH